MSNVQRVVDTERDGDDDGEEDGHEHEHEQGYFPVAEGEERNEEDRNEHGDEVPAKLRHRCCLNPKPERDLQNVPLISFFIK